VGVIGARRKAPRPAGWAAAEGGRWGCEEDVEWRRTSGPGVEWLLVSTQYRRPDRMTIGRPYWINDLFSAVDRTLM
jgi:hypothetical protein